MTFFSKTLIARTLLVWIPRLDKAQQPHQFLLPDVAHPLRTCLEPGGRMCRACVSPPQHVPCKTDLLARRQAKRWPRMRMQRIVEKQDRNQPWGRLGADVLRHYLQDAVCLCQGPPCPLRIPPLACASHFFVSAIHDRHCHGLLVKLMSVFCPTVLVNDCLLTV